MKENTSIETLSLMKCGLTAPNIDSILKILPEMKNLKHLNLSDNEFNKNNPILLISAVKSLVNLVSIALNHCEIGKEGITSLFSVMKNLNYLREIYLANNNMTESVAKSLESDFKFYFNSITHLNISGNSIGTKGAISFSKFLVGKNDLQYIRLSSNKIKPSGLKEIINGIQGKGKVKDIDIGDNLLGDKGADYLLEFLSHNKVLEFLNIMKNDISENKIIDILNSLKKQTIPCKINVYGNKAKDETIQKYFSNSGSQSNKDQQKK